MRHFSLLSIALCVPAVALGQAYRWVDDKGQVHYSQTPPQTQDSTYVRPPPPPSAAPNQDAINKSLADAQRAEPAQKREADQAQAAAAARDAQCAGTMNDLAKMNATTAQRLRVPQEQYDARHKELEAFLAEHCR